MRDGLIKRPVIDRNGVLTSRWARTEQAASVGATVFPAPKASASLPPVNGDRVRAKLREALGKRKYQPNLANEDDYVVATVSRKYGDDSELMQLLLRNAEESEVPLTYVRNAYQLLKKNGCPEPAEYVTPENSALSHRLFQALRPRAGGGLTLSGRPNPNDFRVEPLCAYAVMAAPEDQPLIEKLLVEREIHDLDRLKAALVEMKKVATPLVDGFL